jgi:hypothetical protein
MKLEYVKKWRYFSQIENKKNEVRKRILSKFIKEI